MDFDVILKTGVPGWRQDERSLVDAKYGDGLYDDNLRDAWNEIESEHLEFANNEIESEPIVFSKYSLNPFPAFEK